MPMAKNFWFQLLKTGNDPVCWSLESGDALAYWTSSRFLHRICPQSEWVTRWDPSDKSQLMNKPRLFGRQETNVLSGCNLAVANIADTEVTNVNNTCDRSTNPSSPLRQTRPCSRTLKCSTIWWMWQRQILPCQTVALWLLVCIPDSEVKLIGATNLTNQPIFPVQWDEAIELRLQLNWIQQRRMLSKVNISNTLVTNNHSTHFTLIDQN